MTKAKINIAFILLLILTACAIQKPPSGGPPDTTPPVVLKTYPQNYSTNFKDDYVRFEFSKYMNKSQVIENIFISPDIKVNYDWSGKKLDLEFEENLKPNTTYSISLGTDYSDLKGNKPEMSYSIIFSTGEKIDSGKIKGKLYDKKPDGAFAFAYYLNNINPDTLNPAHTKPTYRTQIGSSGLMLFNALKYGKYRVFAVRDVFKDGQYDNGTDSFSSAISDFTVNDTLTPDINFKLGRPIDIIPPMLYNVEPLTQSTILAEFSEGLDSATVNRKTFLIFDSTGKKKIKIKTAFLNPGTSKTVKLITTSPLDTTTKWILKVRCDTLLGLRDSVNNLIIDTASSTTFYAVPDKDTNDLKLLSAIPADSSEEVSTNSQIFLIFNNSIIEKKDKIKIQFEKTIDGRSIDFKIKFPQENIIKILPVNRLESIKNYKISIAGIFPDSTLYLNFKTADERNFGGLAGIIIDSSSYSGKYLIRLFQTDSDKEFIIRAKSNDHKWKFDHIPPGDYKLEISSDSNNNGKYDYGYPYPWEPSEKFYQLPGTIHIKPRWTVEDFKIIYRGK